MTRQEHAVIEELLGVYALNAVDGFERHIVEEHVSECPRCRAEVEQHREVAAMLGGNTVSTSDHVWDQIMGQLTAEAPPLELEAAKPQAANVAPVVPLAERRARRTTATTWLAGVAAAVAMVLGVGLVLQSNRAGNLGAELAAREQQVASLAATLQADPIDQAVNAALSNPDAEVMNLTADRSLDAMLVVMLPDGTGYVVQDSLDPLPADATYQLWAVVGDEVISAGVLGNDPEVVPFHLDPEKLSALVVTRENAGGVAVSQAEAVVAWSGA